MTSHPLKGSEQVPLSGASAVGKADPNERLEVTLVLRRQNPHEFEKRLQDVAKGQKSARPLSRSEYAKQFGASKDDIAAVTKFAQGHGLAVVHSDVGRRTVVLSGTVSQCNAAFGVDLQQFEYAGGSYRGRTGPVHLPDELSNIIETVTGLDNRPQARSHFRIKRTNGNARRQRAAAAAQSFTPVELAELYGFPDGNGSGECIGLIELGGGYRPADLSKYFQTLQIASPTVTAVSIDHATNRPTGDANGPDGEVMLDIEVAGAIAPGATIAVYFAPNTNAGFLDAITTAIHDSTRKPSIISISWGGPESSWTQQTISAFDQAFQDAAVLGITVCVASGDNGSSDGVTDGANHVDFPASSPNVLACGGTSVHASGASITDETVWNDGANGGAGGGGESTAFALPAWQEGLTISQTGGGTKQLKMRGVPDVAGDADPQTGYDVRVDGNSAVFGGTSAVAPLWAGLLARINSGRGSPVGFVNPALYQNSSALSDITQGNNGAFGATPGWDACTGLGSPKGGSLLNVLAPRSKPVA